MRKLAIDCEMVGSADNEHLVARVALVDDNLSTVYESYVKPSQPVNDYRTSIHGITASDLRNAPSFPQVQRKVKDLISGCLLIGHSVAADLKVLEIDHPEKNIRDVAMYKQFQKYNNGDKPALKDLAEKVLGERIQTSYHSPVEDARTAMKLYKRVADDWQ